LLVNSVVDGSPADGAGILVGDVIVALDGKVVEEAEALVTLLRADRAADGSNVTIIRGGEVKDIAVKIGERPVRR
jgi:S1-C subfamily serine protease